MLYIQNNVTKIKLHGNDDNSSKGSVSNITETQRALQGPKGRGCTSMYLVITSGWTSGNLSGCFLEIHELLNQNSWNSGSFRRTDS